MGKLQQSRAGAVRETAYPGEGHSRTPSHFFLTQVKKEDIKPHKREGETRREQLTKPARQQKPLVDLTLRCHARPTSQSANISLLCL